MSPSLEAQAGRISDDAAFQATLPSCKIRSSYPLGGQDQQPLLLGLPLFSTNGNRRGIVLVLGSGT